LKETFTYTDQQEELILRCLKNDQTAFEQLYRTYNKAMYHVCLRMLNNTQEAEDVLQESFITAFNAIHTYSAKSSFGAWLKRIVINKCIDVIRKRKVNFVVLGEEDDLEDAVMAEEDTRYDVESIKKAMRLLPDGYRIILSLYVFEDYTHVQIAKQLGIKEGTSKSQYARAKKKLAELITINERNHEG